MLWGRCVEPKVVVGVRVDAFRVNVLSLFFFFLYRLYYVVAVACRTGRDSRSWEDMHYITMCVR